MRAIVGITMGLILLTVAGMILWEIAPTLLALPEMSQDGSNFGASQAVARPMLILLGSVLLSGALACAVGLKEAVTGEVAARLIMLTFASLALFVLCSLWLVARLMLMQPS
jgi:hypothetical protein